VKLKEISIGNYKCFSEDPQGFIAWGDVNLVIGRNNSGKSRLLDLVRYLCDSSKIKIDAPSFISVVGELEEFDLARQFQNNYSGGEIAGNHWDFGKRYIGRVIKYKYLGNNVLSVDIIEGFDTKVRARFENVAKEIQSPLAGKTFIHVAAERSIKPEVASKDWIDPDGKGATAVIQRYLNDANLPSELVEVDLLRELNSIFEPDNRFTRILVQQHSNGEWEVYLEEEGKGRIPLSASGSGLQTVLLILLGLHTATVGEGRSKSDLVVAIEEPENNLHPALQRRLLSSLQEFAKNHGAKFFITTHSTVAIDQFVGQKDARLFHVRHDGKFAKVSAVEAYSDGHEILRDLDVRASDLLQSNGIIWVEGPTDRLYINKWIELASNGQLREGAHYQCVFYGGKLLSHLSVDGDLSLKKELIDLITVNKNAAIVIDSDRRSERGRLNATKSRIKSEFESIGAFVWVTKGREIENYIHKDPLVSIFGPSTSPIEKLNSVMDWVLTDTKRKKIAPDKITLASKVVDRTLTESCLDVLDLHDQVSLLISKIKSWNNL
jgi:putative ATP-dependent endonuclease of the OLD family